MDAGRELDAKVAEEVMGWVVNRSDSRHWHTVGTERVSNPHRLIGIDCCHDKYAGGSFCPSSHPLDAWEVVERIRDCGGEWEISSKAGKWTARVYGWPKRNDLKRTLLAVVESTEAPFAISLAAIRAMKGSE